MIHALSIAFAVSSVLAFMWARALEHAAARRRASLEPVMLLPKCVAVPAAWRKRIGWWM